MTHPHHHAEAEGGKLVSCLTCKWAKWQLTDKGRIRRKLYGTCTVEVQMPIAPKCDHMTRNRMAIWATAKHDCRLFTARSVSAPAKE